MKWAWWLAVIFPSSAMAASGIGGYLQEHWVYRTHRGAPCAWVRACSTMANEQRAQLLADWQPTRDIASTWRVDAVHDGAIQYSRLIVREGYVDFTPSQKLSVRFGRQVMTWGVGDYLFVNDIFPKNYDAFFTGKPFDHLKEAVDAVKVNGAAGESEVELVVMRPRPDQAPLPSRFIAAAVPGNISIGGPNHNGIDTALRFSTKLARWDVALYAGRYRGGEAGLRSTSAGASQWELQLTRHIGASATGSIGNGVGLAEVAYLDTDLKPANMNPYAFGKRVKALMGYARDFGEEISVNAQYHVEHQVDYDGYVQSLVPSAVAAQRTSQTAYLKLYKSLLHHTAGIGIRLFASSDGGKYINPFASYSVADGLNLELGSNWFGGPPTSRYGMMKYDSNAYTSLRYSF